MPPFPSKAAIARKASVDAKGVAQVVARKNSRVSFSAVGRSRSKGSLSQIVPLGGADDVHGFHRVGSRQKLRGQNRARLSRRVSSSAQLVADAPPAVDDDFIVIEDDGESLARRAATFVAPPQRVLSVDTYKYSLFENLAWPPRRPRREITPQMHALIAHASVRRGDLGIVPDEITEGIAMRNGGRGFDGPAAYGSGCGLEPGAPCCEIDSERCVILAYADRAPTFVPKLDFSGLPNFRQRPHRFQQPQVNAQMKKVKGGTKGIIGYLTKFKI